MITNAINGNLIWVILNAEYVLLYQSKCFFMIYGYVFIPFYLH